MGLYRKALIKSRVPAYFHVPYVESGYRYPNQSWTFYIYSVFYNNMETLNVWTHVLGSLLMTSRLYQISVTFDLSDPYTWPLLASTLSFSATYVASSVAHTFSHKSTEVNCCMFMIDFACIGLFGFGALLNHYHYSVTHPVDMTSLRQVLFVGACLSVLCCACGAASKTVLHISCSPHRGLVAMVGVGLLYLLSIVPIVARLLGSETTSGIQHHSHQMLHVVASGFFFSSRLPERLWPGTFDFLGNSHQVFHLLMVQASDSHIHGVIWDMLFRKTFRLPSVTPSFWSTFGLVFAISMVDILVLRLFYISFKNKGEILSLRLPPVKEKHTCS